MTFKTIHTLYALSQITVAEASGGEINLTHMAVGDGAGNPVEPVNTQTNLVREVYRTTINRVYQDPVDRTRFTTEMVIPAGEGGFTMREIGVFDADGGLFVVGNLPETYKATDSDGAYSDTVIRVDFKVSTASVITLQIDPNIAVATQSWITNHVTAAYLLPGGTTHQVLRKKTNIDGDTEWADPTDVSVSVDMIEETQTLADTQTAVTFSVVTTAGLAIYINGMRLRADEWTKDVTTPLTKINLVQSYPAASKLIAVQNEPANSLPDPLVKSQNLADLPNKMTARGNLDVPSMAEAKQRGPAGMVASFAMSSAPTGWLKCNGAAVSRAAYSELFAVIGTIWGDGDGFNTFNLPDMRGEFVRGWDDGRGIDSGRTFASSQKGTIVSFDENPSDNAVTGQLGASSQSAAGLDQLSGVNVSGLSYLFYTGTTKQPGNDVTNARSGVARPRNQSLLYCIKY